MVLIQKIYLEQLQNTDLFTSDKLVGDFLQEQVTEAHSNGLNEILKLLDEGLLVVSKASGMLHYIKVRKIMKSKIAPSINLHDIGIEETFDRMLVAFSNHFNPEKEQVKENG
jgi:hypothetical protein